MTITNWYLTGARAVIVTDALASDASYSPSFFLTKGRSLPHLQTIMAVKGALHPLRMLWERCMNGLMVRDVAELASIAGPFLAHSYDEIRAHVAEDECAVFMFGWSASARKILGFAFRVETGFTCERLTAGQELIPALRGSEPADWLATARQQQDEDRALPLADRDNIGGCLVRHQLVAIPSENRARIEIDTLEPMKHYEDDWRALSYRAELLPPTAQRWHRCEAWLAASLAYDPAGRSIEDVRRDYSAGKFTLLEGQRSAALVQATTLGTVTHLHVYLAGGDLSEITNYLRPQIEALARRVAIPMVVVTGRRGWARAWSRFNYRLVAQTSPTNWITTKVMNAA